jgi:hypothetical protein
LQNRASLRDIADTNWDLRDLPYLRECIPDFERRARGFDFGQQ